MFAAMDFEKIPSYVTMGFKGMVKGVHLIASLFFHLGPVQEEALLKMMFVFQFAGMGY